MEEQYYLIPKEILDKYIKDDELNAKSIFKSNFILIDLSDSAIEREAFQNAIGFDEDYGYKIALTNLKNKLNGTRLQINRRKVRL